ncbi:hypothetical protein EDB85DRAFT_249782 [Lactarius pseudohatsudake]|nr:hypothetical protein EDB85DRAFT_249782 [Lactarius pseudohatsudake]
MREDDIPTRFILCTMYCQCVGRRHRIRSHPSWGRSNDTCTKLESMRRPPTIRSVHSGSLVVSFHFPVCIGPSLSRLSVSVRVSLVLSSPFYFCQTGHSSAPESSDVTIFSFSRQCIIPASHCVVSSTSKFTVTCLLGFYTFTAVNLPSARDSNARTVTDPIIIIVVFPTCSFIRSFVFCCMSMSLVCGVRISVITY